MKCFLAIWLFLALFSLAWAQLDPKAAPFLDYSQTLQNPTEPKTMAYTSCFTVYEAGKAQPEICLEVAMDFVKRRLATRTTATEDPDYDDHVVYQNGHVRITNFLTGEPTALPATQAKPLEQTFEKMFEQVSQGTFVPKQYERTTYDGPVRYGEVIAGEQVSATVKLPFSPSGLAPAPTTIRLIFGKDKKLLGTVTPTLEGEVLSVYDNPDAKMAIKLFSDATSYRLEGKKPVLASKSRLVQFRLNRPLNEKLFTFGP